MNGTAPHLPDTGIITTDPVQGSVDDRPHESMSASASPTASTGERILAVLAANPTQEYTYRQLADELRMAIGTISGHVNAYAADGLLSIFPKRMGNQGRPPNHVRITTDGLRRLAERTARS
jgi:predicted ArsR family transcriptional regulator